MNFMAWVYDSRLECHFTGVEATLEFVDGVLLTRHLQDLVGFGPDLNQVLNSISGTPAPRYKIAPEDGASSSAAGVARHGNRIAPTQLIADEAQDTVYLVLGRGREVCDGLVPVLQPSSLYLLWRNVRFFSQTDKCSNP